MRHEIFVDGPISYHLRFQYLAYCEALQGYFTLD